MMRNLILFLCIILFCKPALSFADNIEIIDYLYSKHAYYQAIEYLQEELESGDTQPAQDQLIGARLKLKLGNCYFQINNLRIARKYYQQVHDLLGNLNHPELKAITSFNLSILYWHMRLQVSGIKYDHIDFNILPGQSEDSLSYMFFLDGLKFYIEGIKSPLESDSPHQNWNLLLSYELPFHNPDESIIEIGNAFKILSTMENPNPYSYYFAGLNLANFNALKSFEILKNSGIDSEDRYRINAMTCFQKVLDTAAQNMGIKSRQVANAYLDLAMYQDHTYEIFRNWSADLLYKSTSGIPVNHEKAMQKTNAYSLAALNNYQKSICASLEDFSDTLFYRNPVEYSISPSSIQSNCISFNVFRKAYIAKINLYNKLTFYYYPDDWNWDEYVKKFRIRNITSTIADGFKYTASGYAFKAFKYYDKFMDTYAHSLSDQQDKLFLVQKVHKDRILAVDAAFNYQAYNNSATKGVSTVGMRSTVESGESAMTITVKNSVKRSPILDAFYYTEKTKALLLLQEINATSALMEIDWNESVLAEYKELLNRINHLQLKLFKTPDATLKDSLKLYQDNLDAFEASMTDTIPKFKAVKFNPPISTVNQIQSNLGENEALIEYLISPHNYYQFVITKDELKLRTRKITAEEVNQQIKTLRTGIVYKVDEVITEFAWELGRKLIPKIDKDITKLIIVPDGYLNTLPFEVLFTEKVRKENINTPESYPYLVKRYDISYAFSASLYQLGKDKPETINKNAFFMGFAPVFSADIQTGSVSDDSRAVLQDFDEMDSTNTRAILNGKRISAIPNTEIEVDFLHDLFNQNGYKTRKFIGIQANESAFKNESRNEDISIVHFATHGIVNARNPESSGILFMPLENDREDGILHSLEIRNMKLDVNLVTLSACETGLGKLISGEGVLGLSRSFTISGARNVLVSYWKVSDASTSELMMEFYKNILQEGVDFSSALRKAKLKLIESGNYTDPYYWSPFVLFRS